jgi:hypothetical protein
MRRESASALFRLLDESEQEPVLFQRGVVFRGERIGTVLFGSSLSESIAHLMYDIV